MGVGTFMEPLVVVTLLFGGSYFNRNPTPRNSTPSSPSLASLPSWSLDETARKRSDDDLPSSKSNGTNSPVSSLYSFSSDTIAPGSGSSSPASPFQQRVPSAKSAWRARRVQLPGFSRVVQTPNTRVFQDRLLSRLLHRYPFLVEAFYWALIYWVYQLGRAFTALTLVEGTVNVARRHALQVIHIEQALGMFIERPVQEWFLQHPVILQWINRIYSFIHIPGTIFFLVILYYFTTTRKRTALNAYLSGETASFGSVAGPAIYEARRRTMALCNLIAFIIFTLWPCMPPRLLSDPSYDGADAVEAKSFGFVDTVHRNDEGSVWTTNKFCNQYAAMPSMHFGYSLMIGLTIASFPITGLRPLSWKRMAIVLIGMSYPTLILTAIVSTANHFVLDAVAGGIVCGIAWYGNGILLNLLVIEDYFLWLLRIHKPVNWVEPTDFAGDVEYQLVKQGETV